MYYVAFIQNNVGIFQLTVNSSGNMLTLVLLSFPFFSHGFIEIRLGLFEIFLFLFYE